MAVLHNDAARTRVAYTGIRAVLIKGTIQYRIVPVTYQNHWRFPLISTTRVLTHTHSHVSLSCSHTRSRFPCPSCERQSHRASANVLGVVVARAIKRVEICTCGQMEHCYFLGCLVVRTSSIGPHLPAPFWCGRVFGQCEEGGDHLSRRFLSETSEMLNRIPSAGASCGIRYSPPCTIWRVSILCIKTLTMALIP